MSVTRPRLVTPDFLVYRECPCGQFVCTGEGAMAPICGSCGGYFVPGLGPDRTAEGSDRSRGLWGLGFVGFLTHEQGAIVLVNRLRKLLGLTAPFYGGGDGTQWTYLEDNHMPNDPPPYYPEEHRKAHSDFIAGAVADQEAAGKAPDAE